MTRETNPTPAEALAAIQVSRRAVHDRVATQGWRYDLGYAAIVAGMVGAQVLDVPYNITGSTLGVLALALMFRKESRRTGLKVTGVSPAHARWVAITLGVVMAGIMLGVVALTHRSGISAALVATGSMMLAFAVALGGSRVWRRVYRAEMGGQG